MGGSAVNDKRTVRVVLESGGISYGALVRAFTSSEGREGIDLAYRLGRGSSFVIHEDGYLVEWKLLPADPTLENRVSSLEASITNLNASMQRILALLELRDR